MLLLVSGATDTVRRYSHDPDLGRLLTPDNGNNVAELAGCGLPWAADNACYTGLRPGAYLRMLDTLAKVNGLRLLWVSVPDVVGNHAATLEFFKVWQGELKSRCLPVAFVAQDGASVDTVPWDKIDTLFIGGSTRWKLSRIPLRLASWAHHKGKWVHWGRVQSNRRIDWVRALWGVADSFDGSKYSRFPDTYIPDTLARLKHPPQMGMKGVMLYAR